MSEHDERARERAVILQRRAKLVAYAVAAGVATAACSGKTTSVCLSLPASSGAAGKATTTGGSGYCLSIVRGGSPPLAGTGGTIAMGGYSVCLEPIVGGAADPGVAGEAAGGAANEGGAAGEGGSAGSAGAGGSLGGTPPVICLAPPL